MIASRIQLIVMKFLLNHQPPDRLLVGKELSDQAAKCKSKRRHRTQGKIRLAQLRVFPYP